MSFRDGLLLLVLAAGAEAPAAAQVPALLGYQGRLLRADGTAATGTATVGFAVFDADSGGSQLWTETQTLGLSDGYYSTFLGLASAPAAGVFDGGARWIEVKVGSETLSPRQRVGAVAFALAARTVAGGSADVTSLKVAGQTVVDAAGRLSGAARYSAGSGLAVDDGTQTVSLRACDPGQILQHDASGWQCAAPAAVMSVSASSPLSVANGSTTPQISMAQAGTGTSGFLSAADWASFSAKHGAATQCGGDLSGTFGAPVVARLQSRPMSANAPAAGQVLKWMGTQWEPAGDADSLGTVTSLTAVAPLTVWNGSSTPQISMGAAASGADGYLSSADWVRFDAKFGALTQCGGDLDGALDAPIVQGIQGVAISTTLPLGAQVLRFDGTAWSPASLAISDVGGLSSGYVDLSGNQTLAGTKTFATAPVLGTPLGVASGGTGTSSAFSAGSVVFAGTGGAFSQNAAFRWDDASGRLGVGTSAPLQTLDVAGGAAVSGALSVGGALQAGSVQTGGAIAAGSVQATGTVSAAVLQSDGAVRARQLCDENGAHCRTLSAGWDPAVVALPDAPTIAVDASQGTVFEVTLGGNRALGNPTGAVRGQTYTFWIRQDAAGGRSLAWGSRYVFSGNSIPSTVPGALSIAAFSFDGTNFLNTGGHNLSGIVPFNFTNQTGVGTGAVVESNTVVLSGISGAVLASVTGPGNPTLSVNGGAWATSASVAGGDTLKVRATSSANVVTTISVLVVVGGYTTSWSITTTTNPNAFSFSNVLGAAWSSTVESGAATPVGYTGALPVSVTGDGSPQLSVNGGAWAASGSVEPGQTLALRLSSAGAPATTRSATLTMGSYTTPWTVTTTPNPDAFGFTDVPGTSWGAVTTAGPLTPTGHTGPLHVTVTGAATAQISIAGGAWGTEGTLGVGQSLSVRLTSASAAATTSSATVTVGSYSTSWSVTTTTDPSSFSFANVTGALVNTLATAGAATVSGFTAPLTASVTGQGNPKISIAGGGFVTSGTISSGQTLAVQLTSAGALGTAYSATVTVGGFSTTWTVTTASTYWIVADGSTRKWSDGTYAPSCNAYRNPVSPYTYANATGDGLYRIEPSGYSAFDVYCDMTSSSGGWTLVSRPVKNCATYDRAAVGTLTSPSQASCAKLSDAVINAIRTAPTSGGVFWGWQDSTLYPMPASRYLKIIGGEFNGYDSTSNLTQQCSCTATGPWSATYDRHSSMAGVYNHGGSVGWQCVTANQTGCTSSSGTSALFLYQHVLRQNGTFPADSHGIAGGSNGWLFLR